MAERDLRPRLLYMVLLSIRACFFLSRSIVRLHSSNRPSPPVVSFPPSSSVHLEPYRSAVSVRTDLSPWHVQMIAALSGSPRRSGLSLISPNPVSWKQICPKHFVLDKFVSDFTFWVGTGVMFQDITTLLLDPQAFKDTIDLFVERYKGKGITVVAGQKIFLFINYGLTAPIFAHSGT